VQKIDQKIDIHQIFDSQSASSFRLISVGETGKNSVALLFGYGEFFNQGYVLATVSNDGIIVKSYTKKDFTDVPGRVHDDMLKQKDATPGLLLDGDMIYLYILERGLVIEAFPLSGASGDDLVHGPSYDERSADSRPGTVESHHNYQLVRGFLVVEETTTSSQSTPNAGRRRIVEVFDMRHNVAGDSQGDIWKQIVALDSVIRECEQQMGSETMCSIESVTRSGSGLLVFEIKTEPTGASAAKRGTTRLVVVDVSSSPLQSVDVDLNFLDTQEGDDGQDSQQGPTSPPDYRPIVLGTLNDLVIGRAHGKAVDLYRYHARQKVAISLGSIAWKNDVRRWMVASGGNLLLGASDGVGVVWDISRPTSDRAAELRDHSESVLVQDACDVGLLSKPASPEAWQKAVGWGGRLT
jgi:hypothetical protein